MQIKSALATFFTFLRICPIMNKTIFEMFVKSLVKLDKSHCRPENEELDRGILLGWVRQHAFKKGSSIKLKAFCNLLILCR